MPTSLRYFLKIFYRIFLPRILRKNLDLFHSLRTSAHPVLLEKPRGNSVLVLSPHADDEVIGCGGVLAKHASSGDSIKIVYMTDGSRGSQGDMDQEELVSLRKLEAERARNIIGIRDFVYLDYPDGELNVSQQTITAIQQELQNTAPDVVYAPFFLESHADHFATAIILAGALQGYRGNPYVYAYEVWTPLIPTSIVDISQFIEVKRDALKQYETQRANVDVLEIFEAMAKYRAFIHLGRNSYVECFFSCTSHEYVRLSKLLS